MTRSPTPFLAGAVALAALVFILFLNRRPDTTATPTEPKPPSPRITEDPKPAIPAMQPDPVDSARTPLEALENAGVGASSSDPAQLLEQIAEALESGDFDAAGRLIGTKALTPEARQRLAALAANGQLKLRRPFPASEVGEIELNKRTRWALHIDDAEPGRDRIFFDLFNKANGWSVESIAFPPSSSEPIPKAQLVDALGIADAFLQAALRQDFQMAKEFVSPDTVSDAKIAGLCILFEEGGYRLRPTKPLRAVFQRDGTAGFLAHVLAADGGDAAQFSINLRKPTETDNWKLIEINLDQLLADYARRVAGGDVYYTPLVKNPKGGDTLVLWFLE